MGEGAARTGKVSCLCLFEFNPGRIPVYEEECVAPKQRAVPACGGGSVQICVHLLEPGEPCPRSSRNPLIPHWGKLRTRCPFLVQTASAFPSEYFPHPGPSGMSRDPPVFLRPGSCGKAGIGDFFIWDGSLFLSLSLPSVLLL